MNDRQSIKFIILAVIAALLLSAAGYFGGYILPKKPQENNTNEFNAKEVIGSVLEVKCGSSVATGFVFKSDSEEPVAVTCWHTVKSDPTAVEFKFNGKSNFEKGAVLIGFDPDYDVAVYSVKTAHDFPKLKIRTRFEMGEEVYLLGNSKGDGIGLFSGLISVPDDIVQCSDSLNGSNIDGKSLPAVRVTAPINYGSSGAPVFDKNGNLVGMGFYQVFGTTERPVYDMNYAVPSVIIQSLVNAYTLKQGETDRSPVTLKNYIKGEGEEAFRVYEAKFKKLWTDTVFSCENGAVYAHIGDKKLKVLTVADKTPASMAEFLAYAIDYEFFGGKYATE